MQWSIRFALLCLAGMLALGFLIWAQTGFSTFGLDEDDFKFLAGGSIVTCLVAIALMTAMFYSNRSGKDEI
jgi:hypothetical protein